jgi:transposase
MSTVRWVGLDVHAETIAAAMAESSGEVRSAGVIPNRPDSLRVAGLQAPRGVALVTAVTLVADVGRSSRFASPRQLMGYRGLGPREHSSGGRRSR